MDEDVAVARPADAWSELTALAGNRYRLRLGGSFRPAWVGALCTGLSQRQLSIEQAHGRRQPDGTWIAELKLLALAGAIDVHTIPFVELANAELVSNEARLQLVACRAIESRDHGGSLRLALEANDELGLLAMLLASLGTLLLFPVELHIETRLGRAEDTLWLGGVGGSAPTTQSLQALQRLCDTWTRG